LAPPFAIAFCFDECLSGFTKKILSKTNLKYSKVIL